LRSCASSKTRSSFGIEFVQLVNMSMPPPLNATTAM